MLKPAEARKENLKIARDYGVTTSKLPATMADGNAASGKEAALGGSRKAFEAT